MVGALVSTGDSYQPRVLPSVFSDIPSSAELQRAKSARASLTFWVILLLGALIAAIAALLFVLYADTPLTPTGRLQEQNEQLERDIGRLSAELNVWRGENPDTASLAQHAEALAAGEALRKEIRALVAEESWRGRYAENVERSAWTRAERDQALADLQADIRELQLMKVAVQDARPPRAPRPAEPPGSLPP